MNSVDLQHVGNVVGFLLGCVLAYSLLALLAPWARRGRLARACAWFWAGTVGGALWILTAVAIGGTHQLHRDRYSGGWHDAYWTPQARLWFAGAVGMLAALISFLPSAGSRSDGDASQ